MTNVGTIIGLADAVRNREVRAADEVERCLDRVAEPASAELNCLREVHADEARRAAAAIDDRLDAGDDVGHSTE